MVDRAIVRFALISFIIGCSAVLLSHCEEGPPKKRISLSGCSIGGAAYQIAAGQAKILNTKMGDVLASVEATGCGVDSTILNNTNQVDFGSAANGVVYQAYRGIGRFENKKHTNIRGWVPCYQLPLHIVVPHHNPARTIADLKGKRISVGIKGSGSEVVADEVFTTLGMPYAHFKPYYLKYRESLDGLKAGTLDATIFVTGIPVPALLELEATHPFKLIPLSEENVATLTAKYSYYFPVTIPGETYKGIGEIKTVGSYTITTVHKDLSDDFVYRATKAFWENQDIMIASHPSQKKLDIHMVK
jgi:TRAP transporter TAXI family solute receptor